MTLKAFISSTSQDLGEYRQAAYEVCNRLQIVPIGMELFESMGTGATAASLHKLDNAQVYIGIFANRYGYIEAGHDRSVTELEFEHAALRGIERLCFLSSDAAQLPVSPENPDKLAALRARVDTLVRSSFGSPWEFRFRLYTSLLAWLYERRGESPLLRDLFRPLFEQYRRFAGRATVLERIEQFVRGPESGFLVVTAPAGYGKTALAAQLVERHRAITAYHFFTTLYESNAESDVLSEAFFLRNVTQQLRLWDYLPHDDRATPATLSGWVAAYQHAFGRALDEPRLLLIDGLDEVRSWKLKPYLMAPPGAGLKVVVTLRDVGQDWRTEYGLPPAATTHLPLGGLAREDVRAALLLAGTTAAHFAAAEALLDRVVALTTPEGPTAGADPLYVGYLADALESGDVTEASLATQPARLEDDLNRWWGELVKDADDAALDLLATLAVALGPIGADDLRRLHPSLVPTMKGDPLAAAVGRLRRTVAGSLRAGYSFAHPRFRDHVRQNPAIGPAETALRAHVAAWATHGGRYALEYAVRHRLRDADDTGLFATVLDPAFQQAQHRVLGSARRTLADLALAVERAADAGRPLDLLRSAAAYRRIAGTEGATRQVLDALRERRHGDVVQQVQALALDVKAGSPWVLALRCYLVCAAARAGDHDGAVRLAEHFGRQFGLAYHGASHLAARLCDTLIAGAVVHDPALAPELGVDPAWAPSVRAALAPRPAADPTLPALLQEARDRVLSLEWTLGEQNVSAVEFIDEERAGEYTMRLEKVLIGVAGDPAGREPLERAIGALLRNPYPRYRDNGLVALAIAAQACADWGWAAARIETILETGLEREGVTFTCDLAAQLAAEAARRGLGAGALAAYLDQAGAAQDRWGTALRCKSARAAAQGSQGLPGAADTLLAEALGTDTGFAGYAVLHVLGLGARWCELGRPERVADHGLAGRARGHAGRVRDPRFGDERKALVDAFAQWMKAPAPGGDDALAALRQMPDADMRRAYKDLLGARWRAAGTGAGTGTGTDWGALAVASLNDATAIDAVLGRLLGLHCGSAPAGGTALSDAELTEAIALCAADIATSRPWELQAPAYG